MPGMSVLVVAKNIENSIPRITAPSSAERQMGAVHATGTFGGKGKKTGNDI